MFQATNNLTRKYHCGKCNDTHTIRFAVRYTRKQKTYYPDNDDVIAEQKILPPDILHGRASEIYPYPEWSIEYANCPCQRAVRIASIFEAKDLPEAAQKLELSHFQSYSEYDRACKLAVQLLSADFIYDENERNEQFQYKPGLMLVGPTGTGKSTLAGIVLRHRMNAGDPGAILNFPSFVEQLRASYDPLYADKPIAQIADGFKRVKVLVVDDLGSQTRLDQSRVLYGDDVIECMRIIFQHRLYGALPTIITTNLGGQDMKAQFGEVVKSRLSGLCHVASMAGQDFREIIQD